ncbi:MAG TPA: PAS domain S-box protein [Polyangia bacterium]|nr:PAS domain S-box protein [Polyangia bacterium]
MHEARTDAEFGRNPAAPATALMSLQASIVDSAADAIISTTSDGVITSWNRGAEALYGYAAAEILGRSAAILCKGGSAEMHGLLAKIRGGGQLAHYEAPRLRKDGETICVAIASSSLYDRDGALIGLCSIGIDVTARKHAEKQAGSDSQYARSLIEASLDPLVTISAEGKITDVNEGSIKVTGRSRETLIGTDFCDYFTEPAKAREGYQEAFSEGSVTDYPLTIRHEEGKLTEVLYNASVYKDAEGRVLGVVAVARDVTHQKKAGEERSRLAAIVDTTMDAFIGKSLEGVVTSWNKGAARTFGYTADEMIGQHVSVLIPPNLRAEEQRALETLGRGVRLEPYETLRVRKTGEIFDVLLTISPVQDADGRIIGASSIARDITTQKHASQYARSLIEASLDPLVTISPEGRITDVNEGAIRVTGVPRERLIGTDFSDYFAEPEKARAGYQQVFSTGFVTDYPLTMQHRDGMQTNVLYTASLYKDVRGNVLGVFAAARDVTAQRKAEAEVAAQRTRELERLAELERFQKLTVGRELKMIELKKEIEDLKKPAAPAALPR